MKFNFFKRKKEENRIEEDTTEPKVSELLLRYRYEWNEDVPLEERDTIENPSRPFCKKLMELGRLYTRADIEKMSQHLGYSVWDRKGGDGCRHRWVSQIYIKEKE